MTEAVTIHTNDTKHPKIRVTVTGRVDKFVDISSKRARLQGPVGKSLTTQIRIIPSKRFPFKIAGMRAKNGQFIKFDLKETEESGQVVYLLNLENTKKEKGRYNDVIYLEPDDKKLPEIVIYVYGNILDKEPGAGSK